MTPHALLHRPQPRPPADAAAVLYHEAGRLRRAGRRDEAIAAYDAALRHRPAFPEALRAGADLLRECGNVEGALRFLAEALRLRPAYRDAALDHCNLLVGVGRHDAALASCEAALAMLPGDATLLTNRGVVLHDLGRLAEALAALDAAAAADAALPQAQLNRGNVLARMGRHGEAVPCFDRALALRPAYPAAHANRGQALTWLGRFGEAAAAFAAALALEPGNAYALANRGRLRLLLGDYAGGLPDYEARLRTEWQDAPFVPGVPLWSGAPLAGLRLAALADGGSGDVIQFSRYVPLLVAAGARVTVVCRPRLQRLLAPAFAGARVAAAVEEGEAFDAQLPFTSLPWALATRADAVPGASPALRAEPERAARWAERLGIGRTETGRRGAGSPGGDVRIGLCWRGNQDWRADPHRSVPLDLFAPLAALPGVRLVSLQPDAAERPDWPLERLDGLDTGADAFLDTAAVMANLDLVVTCDTAVAHLAGALARPTLLLLQPVPEWRWMLERADTPWYPSLRLHRQPQGEGWAGAVAGVVAAVAARAARC